MALTRREFLAVAVAAGAAPALAVSLPVVDAVPVVDVTLVDTTDQAWDTYPSRAVIVETGGKIYRKTLFVGIGGCVAACSRSAPHYTDELNYLTIKKLREISREITYTRHPGGNWREYHRGMHVRTINGEHIGVVIS